MDKNKQYYLLELDDYAAPAFVSGAKNYFGTLSDIEGLICAIKEDERCRNHKQLTDAFDLYKKGETGAVHTVAYAETPLLVPVNLCESVNFTMPGTEWEHINVWRFSYQMRFQSAEISQFWLETGDGYVRAMKAKICGLEYGESGNDWYKADDIWGFPHMIETNPPFTYNRLAVTDRQFDSAEEFKADYERFLSVRDTDFTEFCNDIFGDG